jgi:hypothetical protein
MYTNTPNGDKHLKTHSMHVQKNRKRISTHPMALEIYDFIIIADKKYLAKNETRYVIYM